MECFVYVMLLLLSVLLPAFCLPQMSWVPLEVQAQNVDTNATYLDCIEQFQERHANITNNLMESVTLCQTIANNVKVSHDKEKEKEKEELRAASAELCGRLNACNALEMDEDFFGCHAEGGHTNMLIIININVNATKALVDLEDRYSEVEKQRLHCTLEAERDFLTQTLISQEELAACLNTTKARRRKRTAKSYVL